MERTITKELIDWKTNNRLRKPLLVRGARQVGKSYSIIDFGKKHFNGNVHIVNFERNPEYSKIFDLNLDVQRIISELELLLNKPIQAGEDLLFFDEIQECPNAIKSLRYFYEQKPELHVISAGSLLEFAMQDISFPVGRLQILLMSPMTFVEFLQANHMKLLADKIASPEQITSKPIIEKINIELRKYFMVGGMPECVKSFVNTNSYLEVAKIQSDLLVTFRQDFSKYATYSDKRCLNTVLTTVATKVGEQIKYSHLAQDFSNPTIKKAFELMETARLYTKIHSASPSGVPLAAGVSEKKFKVVFLDIGLMSNINNLTVQNIPAKSNLSAKFNGKLAEQFIGQELRARREGNLYYWSRETRGSNAEVDYLIEKEGEIIPIEVKSGSSGQIRSLHLLLEQFKNVKKALVFTDDRYGELPEQKLLFKPLFSVSSIT